MRIDSGIEQALNMLLTLSNSVKDKLPKTTGYLIYSGSDSKLSFELVDRKPVLFRDTL